MDHTPRSARIPLRRIHRRFLVGLIAVFAAIAALLSYQARNSSSSSPPSFSSPPGSSSPPGAKDEADGAVPDGTTVLDEGVPAVDRLRPELREALRRAARAARDAGGDVLAFSVNSGWRSAEYQDRLLREAVSKYGSEAEAARWVATAKTSPHVSGQAVDIGSSNATAWLSEHGDEYGLCQVYRNEPWHYELRPEAAEDGCPHMYADPTQDPRMRK
ncbi:D-alanyl-D-alanine carboxypeptidase family protein [Streptomyces sp. NPDC048172]|uniref:D-alanyl-D-alanine carboxypeptidase family protein n=1 Tax=Streptomyces sp. NPDC048172 TaxID=3365505 RepID=UPI00371827A0